MPAGKSRGHRPGDVFCHLPRQTRWHWSGADLSLREIIAHRVPHEFDNRLYADFAHQGGAMGFNGFDTDPEHLRDRLVAMAFRQKLNDLSLARGQPED
jgi:hypothetical protein